MRDNDGLGGIPGERVGGPERNPYAPQAVQRRPDGPSAAPATPLAWVVAGAFTLGGIGSATLALAGMLEAAVGSGAEGAMAMVLGLTYLGGAAALLGGLAIGMPLLGVWTGLAVKGYKDITEDSVGWSPIMSGLSYFICILNFYAPHQIVTRLWARTTEYDEHAPMAATPPWVNAWWPLWIGAGFLSNMTSKMSEEFGVADSLSSAVMAAAFGLTALVVHRLQGRLSMVTAR